MILICACIHLFRQFYDDGFIMMTQSHLGEIVGVEI